MKSLSSTASVALRSFKASFCLGLATAVLSASGAVSVKPVMVRGDISEKARPLPVLLVIADQQDFHYQEYAHTRYGLEASGVPVVVGATTTAPSVPHPNTGQPVGDPGTVAPDVALADVNPARYSAIAFVGGWGASMYQYAYNDPDLDGTTDNFYAFGPYNGDDDLEDGAISESKETVNRLIGAFLDQGKPAAAVCHGVTVLAWARVDGVSPLRGRRVSVPFIGSPATFYRGRWYANFQLSQYEQVVANGGIANRVSGQYGNPGTVADDVVVDGRIITAENFDSALAFGKVLAREVIALQRTLIASPVGQVPPNAGSARPRKR